MPATRQGTSSILPMTADRLCFSRNGARLLADISFTLPAGGITIMIGPNGAGKSLTLRLCHGLLTPTSGGIRWSGAATARKRHGMVFQRPVMLRRSVTANIGHAIAARGTGRRNAVQALERFGLSELGSRPARMLSGGEQQRLAIARAWALEPELLFLDEPTSHLDPGATRLIEEEIRRLAGDGVTILMTTHDLGQARRLAERILFLNRGRLVEDGPAAAFFDSPQSAEARAFLRGELI